MLWRRSGSRPVRLPHQSVHVCLFFLLPPIWLVQDRSIRVSPIAVTGRPVGGSGTVAACAGVEDKGARATKSSRGRDPLPCGQRRQPATASSVTVPGKVHRQPLVLTGLQKLK